MDFFVFLECGGAFCSIRDRGCWHRCPHLLRRLFVPIDPTHPAARCRACRRLSPPTSEASFIMRIPSISLIVWSSRS